MIIIYKFQSTDLHDYAMGLRTVLPEDKNIISQENHTQGSIPEEQNIIKYALNTFTLKLYQNLLILYFVMHLHNVYHIVAYFGACSYNKKNAY